MAPLEEHVLHLLCQGAGSPTVVLESDLDPIGALSWSLVQSQVAERSRACSYDRAGIMWSEPGPRPRDGERIAAELSALLNAAGEDAPYLLVGHAARGAYARIFAGQNRDAVCGMVLVDSVHPDHAERFAQTGISSQEPSSRIRPLVALLSHLGMPRRNAQPKPRTMTEAVYQAYQTQLPYSSVAWYDEKVPGTATLAKAGWVGTLDPLPLIVLSSGRPASAMVPLPAEVGDGRDPQEIWLEPQDDLTALSNDSEIRVLEDSGHYIQFDRPDAVIDAVNELIGRCSES